MLCNASDKSRISVTTPLNYNGRDTSISSNSCLDIQSANREVSYIAFDTWSLFSVSATPLMLLLQSVMPLLQAAVVMLLFSPFLIVLYIHMPLLTAGARNLQNCVLLLLLLFVYVIVCFVYDLQSRLQSYSCWPALLEGISVQIIVQIRIVWRYFSWEE